VNEQNHSNKPSLTHSTSEAHVFFKAGKKCDGYFTTDDLMKQVQKAVDMFESKMNGMATVLFMYDNTPSPPMPSTKCPLSLVHGQGSPSNLNSP